MHLRGKAGGKGEHALGAEPGSTAISLEKLRSRAAADEQHHRNRELRRDQGAENAPLALAGRYPRAFLERFSARA